MQIKNNGLVDTKYLVENLTAVQLRHEIHEADIMSAVADIYRGTEFETDADSFPWHELAKCCREALELQRTQAPKRIISGPHIDIDAIKVKNDIVAVIDGYTKLNKSGKNFSGKCPIHQDKNPSMTVYPENQTWRCYGCNKGGDVIAFIQEIEHTDFRGAVAILGGR